MGNYVITSSGELMHSSHKYLYKKMVNGRMRYYYNVGPRGMTGTFTDPNKKVYSEESSIKGYTRLQDKLGFDEYDAYKNWKQQEEHAREQSQTAKANADASRKAEAVANERARRAEQAKAAEAKKNDKFRSFFSGGKRKDEVKRQTEANEAARQANVRKNEAARKKEAMKNEAVRQASIKKAENKAGHANTMRRNAEAAYKETPIYKVKTKVEKGKKWLDKKFGTKRGKVVVTSNVSLVGMK